MWDDILVMTPPESVSSGDDMIEKKTTMSGLGTLPFLAPIDAPIDMYLISLIPLQQCIAAGRLAVKLKMKIRRWNRYSRNVMRTTELLDFPVMIG